MAKQDVLASILTFLIGLTFVALSSATSSTQDAMDICSRIKSNSLKIQTMGLIGDLLIVLTSEGHLFYLPRESLQNVDSFSPSLTIDHVPLNANRVFGAALDYNIRQDSSTLFFLLVNGKSKSEFLMSLKVEKWQVRFQAYHLDWKQSHKDNSQKLSWTEKKDQEYDFTPHLIVNEDNGNCAQAIQHKDKMEISHRICLNDDDSLSFKPIKIKHTLCPQFSTASYTAFERKPTGPFVFQLAKSGIVYFRIKKIGTHFYCFSSLWTLLSKFIQCGPRFTDNSSRWQPPEAVVEVPVTSSNATQVAAITERRTRWFSGWTISTVILICLSAFLVIMILRLMMKLRDKKRNRKDKQPSSALGSSAISSTNGSSSTVDSSNVSSSGALSACSDGSNCPILAASSSSSCASSNASSGTSSSAMASSISSGTGTSSAASQSKSKHRSFMDTVFGLLKKNKKKNAKQRTNDKKAKENKKKGNKE